MRILSLTIPAGAVHVPTTPIGRTILERCRNWPYPDLTIEILAVLNFPNDEQRRNAFGAAFNLAYGLASSPRTLWGRPDWNSAGEVFLDLLDPIRVQTQKRWKNAADIFIALLSIAATKDERLKGGPSITKAISLLEVGSANRDRLSRDWAAYLDVAHLAAAAMSLAEAAQAQIGEHPDITLESAILADPIRVLKSAAALQEYGLQLIPFSRTISCLPAETLWRVPRDIPSARFRALPLTAADITVIVEAASARSVKRRRREGSQS